MTQGGAKDDKHDWNLGPTGARGWIWGWSLETTDSRQILITKVDKRSPADGVLQIGDVILGVGGKMFSEDVRKSFGRAIGEAESDRGKGVLKLIRWRKGKRQAVEIKLAVMGSYGATSPFHCPKSAKILDAGCRYIAANAKKRKGGIPGQMNAMALLASGKKEYLGLVKELAHRVGPADMKLKLHGGKGMVSWSWGYSNLFLTEYYLATRDAQVLPAIKEYSAKIAEGQSGVGSWGHGMAWPQINGSFTPHFRASTSDI